MKKWNGLCPAKEHGLDFKGQRCDRCFDTYLIGEWVAGRSIGSTLMRVADVEDWAWQWKNADISIDATFYAPKGMGFYDVAELVEQHITLGMHR